MIKKYTINKKEYKTITVPKGTVLFRGIYFEDKNKYMNVFNDLIGYKSDPYYAIPPTMNVFFYPVPYVSDIINIFNIHVMYITQYDIELLLLITPSDISRRDARQFNSHKDIITQCDRISEKDACGFEMSGNDPCFTDKMRKSLSNIAGYIAIAEQDASLITQKYKSFVDVYQNIQKARHILPGVHSNAHHHIGIPEIVMYPLRFRHDTCFNVLQKFNSSESVVTYCTNNRAQYNYFPLLYFTSNGVYTWNELVNQTTFNIISKSIEVNITNSLQQPHMYTVIDNVFSAMLDKGWRVNGVIYTVVIDKRTGFYLLHNVTRNNVRKTNRNKKYSYLFKDRDHYHDVNASIIASKYDKNIEQYIQTHTTYLDDFIKVLTMNGYGINKKLVINNNDKNDVAYHYYVHKVLDRPDMNEYNKKQLQDYKRKYNIRYNRTQRHIRDQSNYLFNIFSDQIEDLSNNEKLS